MARPSNQEAFLKYLSELNGRASNSALRAGLKWSEDKYWNVHTTLYEIGKIEKGRGKGGTVILVPDSPDTVEQGQSDNYRLDNALGQELMESSKTEEKFLYEPIKIELDKHWSLRKNLDSCHVENIARQGSRDTGGSWTRPDVALVGMRTYEYLPNKNLEIHTFEVKPSYDISVKGVMEALSHREFSTKSYVIYCTDGRNFETFPEAKRIEVIAGRYGIGVIAALNPNDFDTWDEVVSAVRSLPDPEEMDLFVKRTLSSETKSKILKWLK